MSDDLGKPVRFEGPGQWRSQAEAAQAHTRPPDAALEVLPVAQRSEPVEGLDWDPEEYLLRAAHVVFDPNLHPRKPDGEFAPKGGGGISGGGSKRPPGWPVNAPPPRPASKGMSEAAAEAPSPSVADLVSMVSDLQRRLDDQAPKLQKQQAGQLRQVTEQLRAEGGRLAAATLAEEKAADLKEEKRKATIKAIVRILALVATGLLILATHGVALPAIALLGVEFGPLIGGELGVALQEAHSRRKARARITRP